MMRDKLFNVLTLSYALFYAFLLGNFVIVNISNPNKLYESEAFSLVSVTNACATLILLIRFFFVRHRKQFFILGFVGGSLIAIHHLLMIYGATRSFGFFPMIFFGFGLINSLGLFLGLSIIWQSLRSIRQTGTQSQDIVANH